MTPEQLASVRLTADLVERALERCASCFYDDLFDRQPRTRRLLAGDLRAGRSTFLDELLALIASADRLDGFLARARALGLRQQRRGLHVGDYAFVGDALVAAVAEVVGDQWTAAVETSWRRMFALVAEAMLEGAEEGLFSPPPAAGG